jgi:hypothetical protein
MFSLVMYPIDRVNMIYNGSEEIVMIWGRMAIELWMPSKALQDCNTTADVPNKGRSISRGSSRKASEDRKSVTIYDGRYCCVYHGFFAVRFSIVCHGL